MSKTIIVSDSTYLKIKEQIESENLKEKKEVGLEIKTYLGTVLFKSTKTTIKEAVEEAVSEGANLTDANLSGANLRDADLEGANLSGANLIGADFYHTKFYGEGGTTKIKQNQIDDFMCALGVIIEE